MSEVISIPAVWALTLRAKSRRWGQPGPSVQATLKQTSEPGMPAVEAGETELLPDSIAGFC